MGHTQLKIQPQILHLIKSTLPFLAKLTRDKHMSLILPQREWRRKKGFILLTFGQQSLGETRRFNLRQLAIENRLDKATFDKILCWKWPQKIWRKTWKKIKISGWKTGVNVIKHFYVWANKLECLSRHSFFQPSVQSASKGATYLSRVSCNWL